MSEIFFYKYLKRILKYFRNKLPDLKYIAAYFYTPLKTCYLQILVISAAYYVNYYIKTFITGSKIFFFGA